MLSRTEIASNFSSAFDTSETKSGKSHPSYMVGKKCKEKIQPVGTGQFGIPYLITSHDEKIIAGLIKLSGIFDDGRQMFSL